MPPAPLLSLLLPLPVSLLYTPSVDNSYTPQAVGAAAIPSAGLVTMVRVCTRLAPRTARRRL